MSTFIVIITVLGLLDMSIYFILGHIKYFTIDLPIPLELSLFVVFKGKIFFNNISVLKLSNEVIQNRIDSFKFTFVYIKFGKKNNEIQWFICIDKLGNSKENEFYIKIQSVAMCTFFLYVFIQIFPKVLYIFTVPEKVSNRFN